MKRVAPVSALLAYILLLVTGCGGGGIAPGHQQRYSVRIGDRVVRRAHSPTFGLPPKSLRLHPRALLPSTVPTELMLDTVGVSELSGLHPAAVAGYTSGNWPTYDGLVAAFPAAYHVSIAVYQTHTRVNDSPRGPPVNCLDVEPGDAPPSAAGPWARSIIGIGGKPCLYANLSTMPDVVASLTSQLLPRSSYFLWDADWRYVYQLDQGFDATQWTDRYDSRNIDGTAATLAFLGVRPAPVYPRCTPYSVRLATSACRSLRANMNRWRGGRDSSLRAYRARRPRCTQPVLGRPDCAVLAGRVDYFQGLRDRYVRAPTCFGPSAQLGAPECQVVRPAVAVWSRAAASTSKQATLVHNCGGIATWGLPSSSRICRILNQRFNYFDRRIRRTVATSRY